MEKENNNQKELKCIDEVFTHEFKPKDIYLAILAFIAENGVESSVTLFLNGVIVSGVIISIEKYSSITSDKINKISNQVIGNMISDIINNIGERINKESKGLDEIEYLHLCNVKIIASNGDRIITNSEMRIKLGEVNGFIFGSLDAQ